MMELPTLDLRRFAGPDRQDFLAELRRTVREIGFFYVTGHGVPDDLPDAVLDASRRFFALPESEKLKVEMVHSLHFRGYNRPGWERTRGKPDWREQFDLAAERPALPRNGGLPVWLYPAMPAGPPFRNALIGRGFDFVQHCARGLDAVRRLGLIITGIFGKTVGGEAGDYAHKQKLLHC